MSTQLSITPLFPGVTVNLQEHPNDALIPRVAGELRRAGYAAGADAFEAVAEEIFDDPDGTVPDDLFLLVRSTVTIL